ncbi:MAG: glycosyltransferase family 4 protein [Planctomycetota bacterium]
MTASDPIKTILCQPALAKYRIPVFRALAERDGIDLDVWYSAVRGLSNVEPDGFRGRPVSTWRLPKLPLRWEPANWAAAGSNADVIVMSWNANDLALKPALGRARRHGVGTVLWGHGYSKRETPFRKRRRDALGKRADAVVLYDRATADKLIADGYDAGRVFVAANTLDGAPMEAARAAVDDGGTSVRAEHELGDAPVLLFVSRVSPKSRLDLLLQALTELPAAKLLVVGGGDAMPLRAEADRLGVGDRVVWVGPVYDERRLAHYFAAADVFVYPAMIGLSLIHAMSYGLPVVTAAAVERQNPEIIALVEGETGLTYRDGDAGDLAVKIRSLLDDEALRQRMSDAAIRRVRSEFSLSNMVDGLEAAIRKAAVSVSR